MDGPVYEIMMASEEFVDDATTPVAPEDGDSQVDQVDAAMHSSSSDDGNYL